MFTGYRKTFLVKSIDLAPSSSVCVRAICDMCGEERCVRRAMYRDLCKRCCQIVSKGTPEQRALHSRISTERFAEQGNRDKARESASRRWGRPEEHRKASESQLRRFENPQERISLGNSIRRGWRAKPLQIEAARMRMLGKSGPRSPSWNSNLTQEERIRGRKYPEYAHWRQSVFIRDDYTCQVCSTRGGSLAAHHLNSYADYPDLRVDVSNGVTLCKSCHDEFHRIYGNHHNTRSQFLEYLASKRLGVSIAEGAFLMLTCV